jgi:hypothetical protein
VFPTELQQDLQRFTTQFTERIAQAMASLEDTDQAEVRDAALKQDLLYASSALDIVTGPFPEVNLLDMLVFVRLCREVLEKHWIPAVYGARGWPVAEIFRSSEQDLARIAAKVLDGGQKAELAELVTTWRAEHPEQIRVEGVRLTDFAELAGRMAAVHEQRGGGVFAKVKAASQAADQALLLAERGMFLVHRMPFLWRLQARLASRQILADTRTQLWITIKQATLALPRRLGELARKKLASARRSLPSLPRRRTA